MGESFKLVQTIFILELFPKIIFLSNLIIFFYFLFIYLLISIINLVGGILIWK